MARKVPYDQKTQDLANLAADRVSDAMLSVLQLCDNDDELFQVALLATAAALGNAAAVVAKKYDCDLDEGNAVMLQLLSERKA